jgi:hypothetical protein
LSAALIPTAEMRQRDSSANFANYDRIWHGTVNGGSGAPAIGAIALEFWSKVCN